MIKNPPSNAEDIRDVGQIPGTGRSAGKGNGNPLQDSCLENSTYREAWQDAISGITRSQTRLSTHVHEQHEHTQAFCLFPVSIFLAGNQISDTCRILVHVCNSALQIIIHVRKHRKDRRNAEPQGEKTFSFTTCCKLSNL